MLCNLHSFREDEFAEKSYSQIISKTAKLNPLFPESSFKTGGNLVLGSAYGIRTRDLLLEMDQIHLRGSIETIPVPS
jgi:hypothetical protein